MGKAAGRPGWRSVWNKTHPVPGGDGDRGRREGHRVVPRGIPDGVGRPHPCHPAGLPRSTSEPRWRPAQAAGAREEAEPLPAPAQDWPSAGPRRAAAAAGEKPGTESPARAERRPQRGSAGGRCPSLPASPCLSLLGAGGAGAGGGGAPQPGWLQLACGHLSPPVPRPPARPAGSVLPRLPPRPPRRRSGAVLRCPELPAKNKTDGRSRFAFSPCKCPRRRLPAASIAPRAALRPGEGGRGTRAPRVGDGDGDAKALPAWGRAAPPTPQLRGRGGLDGRAPPALGGGQAPTLSSRRASSRARGIAVCGCCLQHLINRCGCAEQPRMAIPGRPSAPPRAGGSAAGAEPGRCLWHCGTAPRAARATLALWKRVRVSTGPDCACLPWKAEQLSRRA